MRKWMSVRALLLGLAISMAPAASFSQVAVGISVRVGPPILPVYEQPPCPEEGYLWTPGYWGYGDAGYYWVPGVWVRPPRVGVLWTPGYWGWNDSVYVFHSGYWGPHVGFYGGVDYGYGYHGSGFVGGEWRGGRFAYNTAVLRVNTTVVHNTYINNTVVVKHTTVNRVSYNGGPGGVSRRANAEEVRYGHESHYQATTAQVSHQTSARSNRENFASVNHGRPATGAVSRVNGREGNQQARISQGVRSGQLTPHETRTIENRESHINNEVKRDRAANGGRLTPQEHAKVEHQQNSVSRQIDRDKHNARTDHSAQEQHRAEHVEHADRPHNEHPQSEHPHR